MSTMLIILIVLLVLFLYHQLHLRRRNLPPGPLPLPLVGNALRIDLRQFDASLRQIGREYGGMFTVWLGPRIPTVCITDYDILKEAFVTNGDALSGRPYEPLMDIMAKGNYGLVGANGPMWREHRRFALHTLRDFGVSRSLMEAKINYDLDRMLDAIGDEVHNGRPVDISRMLSVCIGSVVANLVYGQRYAYDDPDFTKYMQLIRDGFDPAREPMVLMTEEITWIRKLPLFGHFGMDKVNAAVKQIVDEFYELLTKSLEGGREGEEAECYIDAFKQHRNKLRDAGKHETLELYSDWQLFNAATEMWFAGMDTTVTTLCWAVGFACAHADVQRKMRAEIDGVLGRRRVTMGDRARLPYTMACITEVYRASAISHFNLNHEVTEDVTVGGFRLKRGTRVQGSVAAVMHDGRHFAQPLCFDPDRFHVRGGDTGKVVPFGMGKRSCIGEALARMEVLLVFATLVQLFEMRFDQGDGQGFGVQNAVMGGFRQPQPFKVIMVLRE